MNLANKITILRILLVPFFISFVLYSRLEIALIVFILAVITDGVDGYVARAMDQKTKIGALLDPIADKILILSAFACLVFVKDVPQSMALPPYVPVIVISRDLIIIIGSVLIYMLKGDIEIRPSALGKITTFLQMATIILLLSKFSYVIYVWNLMIAFTVGSGVEYIMRGSKMLGDK